MRVATVTKEVTGRVEPLSRAWQEAELLTSFANNSDLPVTIADAAYERLFALTTYVLRGPIRSKADAIAKLRAVGTSLERGMRGDGSEAISQQDAISWLATH